MRNIVLIVMDTLRADHLGCYGYTRPTSPFLNELAEKSLVLDTCYSASNFTAPAFTSLFTAAYPSRHGILDFYSRVSSSPIKTCLDANNVRAEGVVTFHFFKNLLARIWGNLEVVTEKRSFDWSKDLNRAVSDGAIEWLEQNGKNGPFVLFLHYMGAHIPYCLPDDYANLFDTIDPHAVDPEIKNTFFPQHLGRIGGSSRKNSIIPRLLKIISAMNTRRRYVDELTRRWVIDKYDACIRYTDDMISRVYEALQSFNLLNDTVIVVLSDHGEELWDHGHFGHGDMHTYDEIIRTVGIIHDPLQPEGMRTEIPVSHIQILPSMLRMAGADHVSKSLAALDLKVTLDRHAATGKSEPVFCTSIYKFVVRLDKLKWIHTMPNRSCSKFRRLKYLLRMLWGGNLKDELYDLATDPNEKVNLAHQRHRIRPMAALLKRHLQVSEKVGLAAKTGGELDDEEREKIEEELRNLGYL